MDPEVESKIEEQEKVEQGGQEEEIKEETEQVEPEIEEEKEEKEENEEGEDTPEDNTEAKDQKEEKEDKNGKATKKKKKKKDDLAKQLKEKKKELKLVKKIRDAVEQKYIATFRENQNRTKDIDFLLKCLKGVLAVMKVDVDFDQVVGYELGNFEDESKEKILTLVKRKIDEIHLGNQNEMEKVRRDLEKEIEELRRVNEEMREKSDEKYTEEIEKLRREHEDGVRSATEECRSKFEVERKGFFKNFEKQKLDFLEKIEKLNEKHQIDLTKKEESYKEKLENKEEMISKLQEESNFLIKNLQEKEDEILRLEDLKKQMYDNEADELLDKFDEIEDLSMDRMKDDSERTNELIKLRNQMENLNDENRRLKEKIENFGSSDKPQSGEFSCQVELLIENTLRKEGRMNQMEEISEKKISSFEDRMQQRKQERESEEQEGQIYFKNLIIKFMIYSSRQNLKEAKVIRKAILDYLKVSSEERSVIDNAISKQGFINDTVFFFNIFKRKN